MTVVDKIASDYVLMYVTTPRTHGSDAVDIEVVYHPLGASLQPGQTIISRLFQNEVLVALRKYYNE